MRFEATEGEAPCYGGWQLDAMPAAALAGELDRALRFTESLRDRAGPVSVSWIT